ncbi:hypothetical protein NXX53_12830 [Bacteroides salyersiae]|nr:hypothetical protein [Bacteroides salyersiae]
MGAVQALIGEREFKELLFKKGLPWIMVFDGYDNNPDDGTVVVTGDLGEAFGADNILYRNVRSQKEIKEKMALWEQLKSLPESAAGRDEIQKQIFAYRAMEDGKLTLKVSFVFFVIRLLWKCSKSPAGSV